mmetsp:Transcript_28127/g.94743  ORF Transcript_28127/g.94743 Transcript_28127/m.94743 type:complete len:248 (-) Transcript_28127:679-1422(-)
MADLRTECTVRSTHVRLRQTFVSTLRHMSWLTSMHSPATSYGASYVSWPALRVLYSLNVRTAWPPLANLQKMGPCRMPESSSQASIQKTGQSFQFKWFAKMRRMRRLLFLRLPLYCVTVTWYHSGKPFLEQLCASLRDGHRMSSKRGAKIVTSLMRPIADHWYASIAQFRMRLARLSPCMPMSWSNMGSRSVAGSKEGPPSASCFFPTAHMISLTAKLFDGSSMTHMERYTWENAPSMAEACPKPMP